MPSWGFLFFFFLFFQFLTHPFNHSTIHSFFFFFPTLFPALLRGGDIGLLAVEKVIPAALSFSLTPDLIRRIRKDLEFREGKKDEIV